MVPPLSDQPRSKSPAHLTGRASLSDAYAERHDRIVLNARNALNRADAGALRQRPDYCGCLSVLSTLAMLITVLQQ
jgi:hypothetical protein